MFPIHTIQSDSAEFPEQMGTKYKFWYTDSNENLVLFKEGRPNTGENWAEKLACEFAEMLGIPHAEYELAKYGGKFGVLSPSFVPQSGRLLHGNELVGVKIIDADENGKLKYYAERSHTVNRVLQYFKQNSEAVFPPRGYKLIDGVTSALDVFVGYILFDAWIANQDRHSENWGIIQIMGDRYLAPSYDHGSSMGRNETDIKRSEMLSTKDIGCSIESYVCKARSALYPNTSADVKVKPYLTYELFEIVWRSQPEAGNAWLNRLRQISMDSVRETISRIPNQYMSEIAKEFTARLLHLNITRLLALKI
jgi:hypothetical protein